MNMNLKSIKISFSVLAIALATMNVQAQEQKEHKNPNVRLGQKALMDGDAKSAVSHLEKALPAEKNDPSVLYLLGYSQFQSGAFDKAADTFGKVIALDPTNANAYYYKGKAINTAAVNTSNKISDEKREQMLQAAINDYTKAIAINKSDAKLYQNRGIAYRDLGILISNEGQKGYNKPSAIEAYNKAIVDFQKVLSYDASRKDIQAELKKATVYRDLLK